MKTTKLILSLFILSILFTSCSDDSEEVKKLSDARYDGIIVSAEGNWGDKDGSISHVSSDLNFLATNFLYTGVNNSQLGSLIQSIAFSDDNAYIILNDANSVVVVDRYTFETVGTINTGFDNPRYMAIVGDKGYVTNWGADTYTTNDDYLAVIDLNTNTLETETISLSFGVEQIVASGDKLYVTHKGAWSTNNIVSVVDLSAGNSVTEIEVNDNPDEIIVDDSGNLIVLCQGIPLTFSNDYKQVLTNTTSSISFINASTDTVTSQIEFSENERASYLAYENGTIYYYKSADSTVYSIDESSTTLATTGVEVGSIYGMSVKNSDLYVVERAFTSLSKLTVIDFESEDEIYSSAVGLGASKIYFN